MGEAPEIPTVKRNLVVCVVLQVKANTRELNLDIDTGRLENMLGPKAAPLQNLRRVDGAGRDSDLLLGLD